MSKRFFCVHGHFYQPPREDPISGEIPDEIGATPYNNWNERIHAECYRPNAELGNFERISFNLGPTLLEWMERHDPETLQRIVRQDRANLKQHGVGNAMAQAYNHTILPLADYEDKVTQVVWGIADFQQRFGRKPEGMWLPETAADNESLSVLADHDIKFTILAPWQADSAKLDPTIPYRVALPQGKSITVFFYHAELSARISFDPTATSNADNFVKHLVKPAFKPANTGEPQLLLLASDGELYGHHQIFRDRFLAHMVNGASENAGISRTFPALWLKDHTPAKVVSIRNKTSWSCHHGVVRWMGECGCSPGSSKWKVYLRRAFDRLGAALNREYTKAVEPYISEPWDLRNRYIDIVLGQEKASDLIQTTAGQKLSDEIIRSIHLLLQAQYERQRMFTSCGWYFEDFSRIEPMNIVAYAAQAVRLTKLATGVDLSEQVAQDLQKVTSNRTGLQGDIVFRKQLQRAEQKSRSVSP
jgi:hypothetical protein